MLIYGVLFMKSRILLSILILIVAVFAVQTVISAEDKMICPEAKLSGNSAEICSFIITNSAIRVGTVLPSGIPMKNEMFNLLTTEDEPIAHIQIKDGIIYDVGCCVAPKPTFNLFVKDKATLEYIQNSDSVTTGINDKLESKELRIEGVTFSAKVKKFFMGFFIKPKKTKEKTPVNKTEEAAAIQFGTKDYDNANGIAITPEGDIYLVGTAGAGFGAEGTGAFIAKYSKQGKQEWVRQFGTDYYSDEAFDIAVIPSGNAYVVGSTQGGIDSKASVSNSRSGYVLKYSASGEKEWVQTITNLENKYSVYPVAVASTSSGDVFIAGYTSGSLVKGATIHDGELVEGVDDAFLMKVYSSGKIAWTKQFGSKNVDHALDVATDSNGDSYVVGYLHEYDSELKTTAFIAKYSDAGTKIWQNEITGAEATNVAIGNNELYVAAHTTSCIDVNIDCSCEKTGSCPQIAIIKYDLAGNKLWTKQSYDFAGQSAKLVADSNDLYVATSDLGAYSSGNIIKLSKDGKIIWKKEFRAVLSNDAGATIINAAALGKNVYATGSTIGSLDGQMNQGNKDIFIIQYNPGGEKVAFGK